LKAGARGRTVRPYQEAQNLESLNEGEKVGGKKGGGSRGTRTPPQWAGKGVQEDRQRATQTWENLGNERTDGWNGNKVKSGVSE